MKKAMKRSLNMSKFLIIPQINNIDESLKLAEKYGFGFEFNDFFFPDVLDDKRRTDELIGKYKACGLPNYCTMHGAFFDVLIFSDDREIRKISEMRIRQSLDIARQLEVKGVVFHTNHTPDITTKLYLNNWLDRNEDFWRRILSEYPDVQVYMENMFDDSPRLLSLLASRMADVSSFGVCFDYAHAVIFGSDIDDWVTSLSPYVKHMHINDNDLKNDLHLAVGEGQLNWQHFKDSFEKKLSGANSVLIETSSIDRQKRSAEFLKELGMI